MISTEKYCRKCGSWKDFYTGFHKDKKTKSGRCSFCKECRNKYTRNWCKNNKDKRKTTSRSYLEEYK